MKTEKKIQEKEMKKKEMYEVDSRGEHHWNAVEVECFSFAVHVGH